MPNHSIHSVDGGFKTKRKFLSSTFLYLILILIAVFFILPLLWMLSTALKPDSEWLVNNLIPNTLTLKNFQNVLNNPATPAAHWFINSLLVSVIFTFLSVSIDAMAAYGYARLSFPGRNTLFGLLIATLVMPGLIFLIPNYLTVARLGWLNSYQGIIIPGLANVFGIFFLRQFFLSLPRELEEAAMIDGASIWTIFFRIVIPLAKPALATLGVINFLGAWNDFLWPLLVMTDITKQTLPVGLATLQGAYVFDYGSLMAGAVISALPVLLIYIFIQRYIVESVAITGLKG